MTQAQKAINIRWEAPYFTKYHSTINILCEIFYPNGTIEKLFLNPNKTLEKSVDILGLYICEIKFPSGKLIRKSFSLTEDEHRKEIVINDTDEAIKPTAIYLHKFFGTYHQVSLSQKKYIDDLYSFPDRIEKLWFRLWTFDSSQNRKAPWVSYKPQANNFSIESYEDAILISLSALPQKQLCYFELGEQKHFSRFIAIPPVKEAQAIICRSSNPTTVNAGLSLRIISTDPGHNEIQSVLYYLKQGYFQAAEDILGRIVQNLTKTNIDPFTITVLSYFLLKTKKLDRIKNINFIIENLCKQYSWLPDSAIIYAWFLIDIGEDKSGFNSRENYVDKIKELLLKAFYCGVPLFSSGFRFLFEKIRQIEMQLSHDSKLKKGLSDAVMLLGQRLSASYEEEPLTTFFGINPGRPTMDFEVLKPHQRSEIPSDSIVIKKQNEQNIESKQSVLNSKKSVSNSHKSQTLHTSQNPRKRTKPSRRATKPAKKKNVPNGIAHIKSTFNNTIVTISDTKGDVISWSSSGASGFKGAKKGTPFAAQTAADSAGRRAMNQGMRQIEVMVSGPGAGRETAIRALQGAGLEITLVRDVTPIPHNGCRPPKKRRV